ncbi:MAG TPA: sigma-70 family RNA polymerase sigma factor [Ignavibacteriaceae bacterium]|nr:sigma-70 family RNA polymerase sigma factor [Ignavibacteriaceae bacterium]
MSEVKSLTDAEIMLKIAGYDSKALEQLYDRYTPLLYTLIKKIIPEKETAEEVLSEVFVIIWRQIDHFDFSSSNVYTWMVTLARNKAIDAKNRTIGKVTEEYTDDYENEKILPKLSPEIESVELEEVLGMKEKIEGAMKSLTDAQKYVIELSYFEGLDESGIAEKLKIPSSTVKSKLQVAIGNLMKKISKTN